MSILVVAGNHMGLAEIVLGAGAEAPIHIVAEPRVLRVIGPRLARLSRKGSVHLHQVSFSGDWEARLLRIYVEAWPDKLLLYRVGDRRLTGLARLHMSRGLPSYSYTRMPHEITVGERITYREAAALLHGKP